MGGAANSCGKDVDMGISGELGPFLHFSLQVKHTLREPSEEFGLYLSNVENEPCTQLTDQSTKIKVEEEKER